MALAFLVGGLILILAGPAVHDGFWSAAFALLGAFQVFLAGFGIGLEEACTHKPDEESGGSG